MSSDGIESPYVRFMGGLADKLALAPAETSALVNSLRDTPARSATDPLDHAELLLAVSLNAQIRNAHDDFRCKKLKFLLRNNNDRAIKIATQWIDQKVTFEAMLAAV